MKLNRHTAPGDDASSYGTSAPFGQSTTDGSLPSPSSANPMSTSIFYTDPPPPYLYSTSTPTPTVYNIPVTSSSNSPSPSQPSTSVYGPAAVTETTTLSADRNLNTLSSLSTSASGTAPATAAITNQTAIIAALTAGIAALVLLVLLAFLLYRRRRRRRHQRQDSRIDARALPQSALLHDDEMAHNARIGMVPTTATHYEAQHSAANDGAAAIYRPASPSLSILRSRVSESGSIFREEVWPPPSPSVDPIQMRSSQVDLSRIVDDVMGGTTDEYNETPTETKKGHRRELTANSLTPLLVERQTSSGHGSSEDDFSQLYVSPISSESPTSPISPPVIDQSNTRPYEDPPEALHHILQAGHNHGYLRHSSSSTSISSSLHSTPASPANLQSSASFRPPSRDSVQGSISSSTFHRTQPKVSSPLVRALTGIGGR